MDIKENLITLAKEKGFVSEFLYPLPYRYSNKEEMRYYLWMCEIQKWIREKYSIDIILTSNLIGYGYMLYQRYPPKNFTNKGMFQLYEGALENGLQEALSLINIEKTS